jgi:hypothetical protein
MAVVQPRRRRQQRVARASTYTSTGDFHDENLFA